MFTEFDKMIQHDIKTKINYYYYKQPSVIRKVDYGKISSDLWKSKIGNDQDEDKQHIKTIVNISFGLLRSPITHHKGVESSRH